MGGGGRDKERMEGEETGRKEEVPSLLPRVLAPYPFPVQLRQQRRLAWGGERGRRSKFEHEARSSVLALRVRI